MLLQHTLDLILAKERNKRRIEMPFLEGDMGARLPIHISRGRACLGVAARPEGGRDPVEATAQDGVILVESPQ